MVLPPRQVSNLVCVVYISIPTPMRCCTFRKPQPALRKPLQPGDTRQPSPVGAPAPVPASPPRDISPVTVPPKPPPRKRQHDDAAAAPSPEKAAAASPPPAEQVQLSIGVLNSDSVQLSVALGALSTPTARQLLTTERPSRSNSVASSCSGDTAFYSADEGDD